MVSCKVHSSSEKQYRVGYWQNRRVWISRETRFTWNLCGIHTQCIYLSAVSMLGWGIKSRQHFSANSVALSPCSKGIKQYRHIEICWHVQCLLYQGRWTNIDRTNRWQYHWADEQIDVEPTSFRKDGPSTLFTKCHRWSHEFEWLLSGLEVLWEKWKLKHGKITLSSQNH